MFKLAETVVVASRTTPGINKRGGVGRITTVNEDGTYDVKYVLGGKESNVEARFIQPAHLGENESGTRNRPRRSSIESRSSKHENAASKVPKPTNGIFAVESKSQESMKAMEREATTQSTCITILNNKETRESILGRRKSITEEDCTARKGKKSKEAESKHLNTRGKFEVGQVVNVKKRMQPGMNKPGGVGRVTKLERNCQGDIRYCVKYVLGGSEKNIREDYISLHNPVSRGSEHCATKRGRDFAENSIRNEMQTNVKKRKTETTMEMKPTFSPIRVENNGTTGEAGNPEQQSIDLNRIGTLRLTVSRVFRSKRIDVIGQHELFHLVNQDSHVLAMDGNGFSVEEFDHGLEFLDKENAIMLRTRLGVTQVYLV